MKNAGRLAICSLATALSVVLLFLGGITFVFVYVMPMLAGMLMIMLKRTFSYSSAWITYVATSILSIMLVGDKECMLMYIMLFGFYPMLQDKLNKIKITILRILSKLIIFNILTSAVQLMLVYVFGIPFMEEGTGAVLVVLFVVLMNALFFVYDRLLIGMERLYILKIEKRIKRLFK